MGQYRGGGKSDQEETEVVGEMTCGLWGSGQGGEIAEGVKAAD